MKSKISRRSFVAGAAPVAFSAVGGDAIAAAALGGNASETIPGKNGKIKITPAIRKQLRSRVKSYDLNNYDCSDHIAAVRASAKKLRANRPVVKSSDEGRYNYLADVTGYYTIVITDPSQTHDLIIGYRDDTERQVVALSLGATTAVGGTHPSCCNQITAIADLTTEENRKNCAIDIQFKTNGFCSIGVGYTATSGLTVAETSNTDVTST